MSEVRIPFPAGLTVHGSVITEIVLREPSFDDYLELGEIISYGKAPDGTIFSVENSEVLRGYFERCLVQPATPLLLAPGGMKLARAVKGAVLGFFRDEPLKDATSPILGTTSSSDAAKDASTPTPSAN